MTGPALLREVVEEWDLALDGTTVVGSRSTVTPVRTADGRPAALKLTPGAEDGSEHEALALQHWHGRGAVLLLRADPRRRVLLLERLRSEDLGDLWDVEACETVAGLYGRLHRPALPQLPTVASRVEQSAAPLAKSPRDAPIPRRLVEQARSLVRDLLADEVDEPRVVHGDLHYANVLAGDREAWLAIAPDPVAGDPHYEPAPMLWHRWEELAAAPGGVRDGLRRRFHTLVDVAALDEQRARDWVVVRAVLEAHRAIAAAQRPGRTPTAADRDLITRFITLAKAVQD